MSGATLSPDFIPVRSSRHADVTYRVDIANGRCPCPGFTHHGHCYHLKKAREQADRCGYCNWCKRQSPLGCLNFQRYDLGEALTVIATYEEQHDAPASRSTAEAPKPATAQEAWASLRAG